MAHRKTVTYKLLSGCIVFTMILSLIFCNSPSKPVEAHHTIPNDDRFSTNVTADLLIGFWELYLLKYENTMLDPARVPYLYIWGDETGPDKITKFFQFINFEKDSISVYANDYLHNCFIKLPDSLFQINPFRHTTSISSLLNDTNQKCKISISGDTLRFCKAPGLAFGTDYYYYVKCPSTFNLVVCK